MYMYFIVLQQSAVVNCFSSWTKDVIPLIKIQYLKGFQVEKNGELTCLQRSEMMLVTGFHQNFSGYGKAKRLPMSAPEGSSLQEIPRDSQGQNGTTCCSQLIIANSPWPTHHSTTCHKTTQHEITIINSNINDTKRGETLEYSYLQLSYPWASCPTAS